MRDVLIFSILMVIVYIISELLQEYPQDKTIYINNEMFVLDKNNTVQAAIPCITFDGKPTICHFAVHTECKP